MKSDRSVPLSEALERFSDPSDWQEFSSLGYCEYQMFFLDGPFTEHDRRQFRAHELKEQLEAEFLAKLTAGALQASGMIWPIGLNARRRTIPAARWPMLTPDFTTSEATGGGLRIVDIRVREAQPARAPLIPTETRAGSACIARQAADRPPALAAAGGAQPRHELAEEALPHRRPHRVWRPGDQQPVQRGLAGG
jgi:hypothetical protein